MNNFFATLAAGAKFSGTANDQAVKLFKKQRQSHSHYRSGNVDSKKDGDDEKEEEEDEAGRKGANSNGEDKQSEEEKEEDDEEEDDDESDGDLDLITPGTTKKRKRDNDDKHQAISEKKLQGAQEEEENPFDVLRKKLQIEVHASSSSLSSASSRMEFGGDKNNNDDQSNQSNQRSFILLTKFSELESLLPFPNQQHSIAKVLNKNIEDSQFKVPTPIQMQAIPCLFQGYDVLGCAPTGSGKTGAFMIPLVAQLEKHKQDDNTLKKMGKYKQVYRSGDIYSMVLAPSRELADQLFREFERFSKGRNFRACVLKKSMAGALGLSPKRKHEEQTHQQQHQQHQHGEVQEKKEKKEKKDVTEDLLPYDFVACTPMQLISLMDMGLNLDRVQCLVFDEVDKLFEMGFLQLIDRIVHACTHPSIQKSMWSATVPSEMEEMVSSVLREPIRINVGTRNAGADSIEQKLIFVGEEEGKLTAFRRLMDDGQLIPPCLLFVHSKQRALELLEELKSDNQDLRVDAIHTERKQAHRDEVIRNFREGKTWFLIATDLVSRGVDFKAVHTVVNIDFPDSATSYVHRIGRTGRAGRFGRAITMFSIQDIENLRMIANVMRLSGCDIPEWMLQLKNPSKASVHRPRKHQPLSLARSSPEFVTHKNNSRTEPGKRPKRNGHPKGKGRAQNRGGKETKKERNKKSPKPKSKQKSKQKSNLNQKQENSD